MSKEKIFVAVKCLVSGNIRFQGIHSSINLCIIFSIGGADYGSVRIGSFMGRKMIKSIASSYCRSSSGANPPQQINGINPDDIEEDGFELFEDEASLNYLCNLSPHR